MIRGVGLDAVVIPDMAALLQRVSSGVLARMFTFSERAAAAEKADQAEYLATRFAVKEAAFKAISPSLPEKGFDFRLVSTGNQPDGSPYIQTDPTLRAILDRAGITSLHVSITTAGGMAMAVVVAEG